VDPGFVKPEVYIIKNYKYKIRYKNEYLFRAPPRALCK
jgi:hypothetical protein